MEWDLKKKKTKQEYCSIAKKENKMKYNKITLLVHWIISWLLFKVGTAFSNNPA